MMDWQNVKDKKPVDNELVLIYSCDGSVCLGYWKSNPGRWYKRSGEPYLDNVANNFISWALFNAPEVKRLQDLTVKDLWDICSRYTCMCCPVYMYFVTDGERQNNFKRCPIYSHRDEDSFVLI